jgi:hypothetical protein
MAISDRVRQFMMRVIEHKKGSGFITHIFLGLFKQKQAKMAIGKDELIHIFIFQRLAAHPKQNSEPSGLFLGIADGDFYRCAYGASKP